MYVTKIIEFVRSLCYTCIQLKTYYLFIQLFFRYAINEIQARLSQENNCNAKFIESKDELTGWINKLEGVLLGEPVLMNYSTVLTNQLDQLKVKINYIFT